LLRRWAEAGKANDTRLYVQLNHPGRQVPKFLNEESVSASSVPFKEALRPYFATPRALTEAEIEDIIERFGRSAAIFEKAGFDGAQIHGAHGYLVSQFLSPSTNKRTDRWGGSPENRRRFALEVYRSIRRHTGSDFGVAIKINSADFQQGGLSEEESTEAVLALAEEGIDFVEISGGTYEAPAMVIQKDSTRRREAYFLSFCEAVREQLDAPLAVTGGFRSGGAMSEALQSGAVDFIGLARTLAVRPGFPDELLTQGDVRCDIARRTTGIPLLDRIGMVELMWYERQLHRIGNGKEPRPHENVLYSLVAHLSKHGFNAIRTRRAR
jgi:2,4-dienoyl-CoA reductase-like NADH-dependent reductase (Old Yellow Enzyme family)